MIERRRSLARRATIGGLAALGLALLVTQAAKLNSDPIVTEDSAFYVILAEALAGGQGYTDRSLVTQPTHRKYPPLFPALLVPVEYLFGRNFLAMKALVLALALIALVVVALLLQGRVGRLNAVLLALAVGFSPSFSTYSGAILSDAPYLCFSLLALFLIERYCREPRWVTGTGLAAALATIAAYLTRSLGLTLLVVFPLAVLLRKPGFQLRPRLVAAGVVVVLCALPAVGWMAYTSGALGTSASVRQAPIRNPYAFLFLVKDEFSWDDGMVSSPADLVPRLLRNLYVYSRATAVLLMPVPPVESSVAIAFLVLPVVLGFVASLHRPGATEVYTAVYGLAILAYPTPEPRYLLPLVPCLLLYLVSGLRMVVAPLRLNLAGPALRTLAAFFLALNVVASAAAAPRTDREFSDFHDAAVWLKTHIPPDRLIMSRKPRLLYVWTNHQGIGITFTRDTARTLAVICRQRIDYVVLDSFSPLTARYLAPAVARSGSLLAEVYSRDGTRILRVDRARCAEPTS